MEAAVARIRRASCAMDFAAKLDPHTDTCAITYWFFFFFLSITGSF